MSGPFGSSQWMYQSAAGFYPYAIDQSLRFNDNDSAYLSRTPSSAGNRKTWTWSGWVKRGNLTGTRQHIFNAYTGSNTNTGFNALRFQTDDTLQWLGYSNSFLRTSAVFRDTSAWYHIVLSVDTTNATGDDRQILYVNGERITALSDNNNMALNTDYAVNSTNAHRISEDLLGLNEHFDGYLAEVNFIDGQALDPTSFGELKSGVWVPKTYSGSYGTNGFRLSFADSSNIGDDTSGNTNDWTANNLVATDVLLDSPTQNWAVLNALLDDRSGGEVHSEGNLKWTNTSGSSAACATGTFLASGKIYFEAYLNTVGTESNIGFGRADETNQLLSPGGAANDGTFVYNCQAGTFYNGATSDTGPSAVSAGSVVSVAYDQATGKTWFAVNGTWYNSGDPASGTNASFTISSSFIDKLVPLVGGYNNATWILNFGQDSSFAGNKTAQGNTDDNGVGDFFYSPPSSFLALAASNLPNPTIDPAQDDVPSDYMNTVLYTGTGVARSITGVNFQPDWVWIKARAGATESNQLFDAVRGATLSLSSNSTNAEIVNAQRLTSFDADGFSVGTSAGVNTSGVSYVAWNWLAGNGTSSNTDGSISSTISVNQKAGFSVVGYTGTGANATVGHGLGAEPDVMIIKDRDGTNNWIVYHRTQGAANRATLNTTNAWGASSTSFNSTDPTSSVFSLGSSGGTNTSGRDYICYLFAPIEGYSAFGEYTGNGSTNGTFVYTGFEVAWLLVKRANSTGNWRMFDNARNTYNATDNSLRANLSNAEDAGSSTNLFDFTSNGFKARGTASDINANGSRYIYLAFAANPFKYANAR